MSSRRSLRSRSLLVVAGALLALVILSPAAQAQRPSPGYEQFAGCPSHAEIPESNTCMHIAITGGHFTKAGQPGTGDRKTGDAHRRS